MDLNTNVKSLAALTPDTYTSSKMDGIGIDVMGFGSALLVVNVGALDLSSGNETYGVVIEESLDNGIDDSFAPIAATATQITKGDVVVRVPLNNLDTDVKRYIRASLIVAGTTPSIVCGAVFELGDPKESPVEYPDIVLSDMTAYDAALAAVSQADYTTVSWAAYQAVVLANVETDKDTQDGVDDATDAITAAQVNLVHVADMTAYNAALAAVVETDYTPESWGIYMLVVGANVKTNQNTQASVDTATGNITTAQEALVPKGQ